MRRFLLRGLAAAVVAAFAAAAPAYALRVAVMPAASTKTKTFQADTVVVGKVVGIDQETVDLEIYPGQPKVAHAVANIKIESALVGAKNVTHVKVAFVKADQPGGGSGPGRGRPGFGGQQYTPAEDHEGVFFLQKHPGSDTYFTVQMGHAPVLSTDANYKNEVVSVKAMVAAFADPVKALSADKAEDRLANALSLAQKYRAAPTNNPSGVIDETPIPADQTKLFMKVLTDLDWAKHADAPKLADALGLMPGNYGIPRVTGSDGEDAMAARQKAFKAWADKFGGKFEVMKVSAKPLTGKDTGTGTVTPVPPIIRK